MNVAQIMTPYTISAENIPTGTYVSAGAVIGIQCATCELVLSQAALLSRCCNMMEATTTVADTESILSFQKPWTMHQMKETNCLEYSRKGLTQLISHEGDHLNQRHVKIKNLFKATTTKMAAHNKLTRKWDENMKGLELTEDANIDNIFDEMTLLDDMLFDQKRKDILKLFGRSQRLQSHTNYVNGSRQNLIARFKL